jgi:hypothetical protein
MKPRMGDLVVTRKKQFEIDRFQSDGHYIDSTGGGNLIPVQKIVENYTLYVYYDMETPIIAPLVIAKDTPWGDAWQRVWVHKDVEVL